MDLALVCSTTPCRTQCPCHIQCHYTSSKMITYSRSLIARPNLVKAVVARGAKVHLAVLTKPCLRLLHRSHLLQAHLPVRQELCALRHALRILRVTVQHMNQVSSQPTSQQSGVNLPSRQNLSSPPRVACQHQVLRSQPHILP